MLIAVWQSESDDTLSATVIFRGYCRFNVEKVELGARIVSPFGNGSATPYIDRTPRTVDVIMVGGVECVVRPLTDMDEKTFDGVKVDGRVTVRADNPAHFLYMNKEG